MDRIYVRAINNYQRPILGYNIRNWTVFLGHAKNKYQQLDQRYNIGPFFMVMLIKLPARKNRIIRFDSLK